MSPIIAIRTNASPSTGIGHLARTFQLAKALKEYHLESHFFLDKENPFFRDYLHPFKDTVLYQGKEKYRDEELDAHRFMESVKEHHIDAVVVDDYRISQTWEKNMGRLGCPLIVLDDRDLVHHQCSMIVDAKWTGEATNERYKDKVPERCVRLLGPKYALLEKSYALDNRKKEDNINILVNLGGGGDMSIMRKLVEKLLLQAPGDIDFVVRPVIGLFSQNRELILSLSQKEKRIKPIINARSLHDCIKAASLYIGAAGTTMYEVLTISVPAVTFSFSQNQVNQLDHLEDLGHYFHLNHISEQSFEKLSELAWLMISHLDRLKRLYEQPKKVVIDGLGAQRVAKAIDMILNKEKGKGINTKQISTLRSDSQPQDSNYKIETVTDKHVNRYLDTRNLSANQKNMINTVKISRLDHYIWWLSTKRNSYQFMKDNLPLLYFWHQPKEFDGERVLIGGWHICSESCTPLDTIYMLSWQLELTDSEFPNLPWVGVIKKTNRFVHLLNKRFGFEQMDTNHNLFKVASKCYPNATRDNFFFFWRPA